MLKNLVAYFQRGDAVAIIKDPFHWPEYRREMLSLIQVARADVKWVRAKENVQGEFQVRLSGSGMM
jgi:hypothetical protein